MNEHIADARHLMLVDKINELAERVVALERAAKTCRTVNETVNETLMIAYRVISDLKDRVVALEAS